MAEDWLQTPDSRDVRRYERNPSEQLVALA
jgi:hypothetical protein